MQVFLIAFLIVGGYIAEELRFGNVHFLVVTLMVFAYDRAEAGSVLLPAAALAVAIATKLTPIALLAYFAFRRRGAVCLVTVAILALLILAPAVVMGPAANARELRAYATYAAEKIDEDDNYSLRGVLVRYLTAGHADVSHLEASVADLPPAVVNGIWLVGLLGLGLAALAALWRDDRRSSGAVAGILNRHDRHRARLAAHAASLLCDAVRPCGGPRRPSGSSAGARRQALDSDRVCWQLPRRPRFCRCSLLGEDWRCSTRQASPYFFGTLILFGVLVMMTMRRKAAHATRT